MLFVAGRGHCIQEDRQGNHVIENIKISKGDIGLVVMLGVYYIDCEKTYERSIVLLENGTLTCVVSIDFNELIKP